MKVKRILASVFAGVIAFGCCFGLVGCTELISETINKHREETLKSMELKETKYFIYRFDANGFFTIIGLTDIGKEQEYLVFPESIEGIPVKSIGAVDFEIEKIVQVYGDEAYGNFQSEKLKKVFIPQEIWINIGKSLWMWAPKVDVFENCPNLKGRIHLGIGECDNEEGYCRWTNVSYLYNYDGAKDKGFYWRDDCDDETIQYIPENPIREGYTFGGWYKEAECINEWNFETDIVPKKNYSRDGYSSTNLYAKWIEN